MKYTIATLDIPINLQITYSIQRHFIQQQANKSKVLSLNKSLKTLNTLFREIHGLFRGTYHKAKQAALYIQGRLLKNHWMESKKNKLCLPEILQLIICKSNI